MGVGLQFNGLDSLIKANKLFTQLHANVLKMNRMTSNVTTNVSGLDKIKELFHYRDQLGQNVTSNVDVHTNTQSIEDMTRRIRSLQGWLNKSHDVKVDADDTKINETKQKIQDLKTQVGKLRQGFTGATHGLNGTGAAGSRLGDKLARPIHRAHTLGGALRNTGREFRSAFTGGMVASGISTAFSGLKSVVKQGNSLVLAGEKAKTTWRNIGLDKSQQNAMAGQMENIGQMTNMSDDDITRMQRSFYSLTDSAPKAESLTKEIVGFGKASGESNNEINRMGRTLPRVLASNKINASMFNRTFRQSPQLMDGIIKASGKSSASFKKMLGAGKLTSQQLQGYMQKAAKGSNRAWSEYTNTFGGRIAAMKKTWATAEKSFARPFTNGLTKSMGELSGKNGSLSKVEKSVKSISASLGKKVGNYIGKAIAFLIKNQKPILKTGSAVLRIAGIMGKTVFKTFSNILGGMFGKSKNASGGLRGFANMLTRVSHNTKLVATVTKTLMALWAVGRIVKVAKAIHTFNTVLHITYVRTKALKIIQEAATFTKRFTFALQSGTGAQRALNFAMKSNPIGLIITAVAALAVGLVELYKHCATFRHGVQAVGRFGVKAFKVIWNAVKALGKLMLSVLKFAFAPYIRFFKTLFHLGGKVFHKIGGFAKGVSHKVGGFVGKMTHHVNGAADSMAGSTRKSAAKSSRAVHGYLSKSGKYYKHYHKGLRKMSSASYKAQERMRSRYAKRSKASLAKYEKSYRSTQRKRSALSRKYGKLRAMYSVKSLKAVEKRFRQLRRNIMRSTRSMYKGTRKYFRRIGSGGGKQFRAIYRAARKWLNRATKTQRKDYKTMNRNSRRLLDGSVKRYIAILRKRFKSQKYYDRMLIKQTKRTNTIMKKLPLTWITRETKGLIANWRRQRRSYVTHNRRMTKALVTHIHSMSHHFRNFSHSTEDIFDEMEDNVEKSFTKFFDKLHDIAGKGMNSVQAPLNEGAQHLNGFVSAFGQSTPPLHSMPSVSYATGTGAFSGVSGLRRPITQLTNAILNDDSSNGQETVIHPNGNVEQPQGANVREVLEPGAEVLNARETALMRAMSSRPVHLANGTGFLGALKHIFTGNGGGSVSQASLLSQAKDSGKQRLLNELQNVIKSPGKILTGMFGNKPSGERGVIGDIVSGAYSLGGQQAGQWWSTLIGQINQELDDDGGGASSSKALNYAMKIGTGKKYVWGGNGGAGYDCSGLVRAMLDKFGVTRGGRTSGSEIAAFPHISRSQARPGDLVGNGEHIGIVSDNGAHHYYSAFDYAEGIKNFPLDQSHWTAGDSSMTFARVPELAKQNNTDQAANQALKGVKSNGAIGGFVKRQMHPMEAWIEKNLVPLMDPNPAGVGAKRWIPVIKRAADMTHSDLSPHLMSLILGTIQNESNGNPTITNNWDSNAKAGNASVGLLQYTPTTFGAYAYPGHHDIRKGLDQLLAFFNSTNYKTALVGYDSANGKSGGEWSPEHGSGPSGGRRFANGGHIRPGEVATVGERGAELFKAPDTGGTIIPHEQTKKIMNRTNNKPVNVKQDIHIDVKDGSKASQKSIVRTLDQYMSAWADKLNRGGVLNV